MADDPNSFDNFCKILDKISNTSSRLDIITILTNYISSLTNLKSIISICYLSTGSIFPSNYNKELNIGETIIIKLISDVTSNNVKKIKEEYKKKGDFGELISKHKQKSVFNFVKKTFDVNQVLEKLRDICEVTGKDSTEGKLKILRTLARDMNSESRKYLIRIVEGKLKIGLAIQTVLISLGRFFESYYDYNFAVENEDEVIRTKIGVRTKIDAKLKEEEKKENKKRAKIESSDFEESKEGSATEIIKTGYNRVCSFEKLVNLLSKHKIKDLLKFCKVTPGIPLKPMLAQPAKNFDDVFKKLSNKSSAETEKLTSDDDFQNFFAEFKYDGERIQVHRTLNDVNLYSRNLENQIQKYMDIIPLIKSLNESEFILDCEIVAIDRNTNKILPFNILATRKRKVKDVSEIKIDVCIFCFDILYFKDNDLLGKTLMERKNFLSQNFKEVKNFFEFTQTRFCKNFSDVESLLEESIKNNCEGLMIKSYNGLYLPSKRSNSWIKFKKDYLDKVGDTLDLAVMGVYYGKGKRVGVYGGFLLGSYNEKSEKIESICKIGTGFDENFLKTFYEENHKNETEICPKNFLSTNVKPDMWVSTKIIWEVKAAELSISPIYDCAMDEATKKGISLRFPRFIKERVDKNFEDCSSNKMIRNLMES